MEEFDVDAVQQMNNRYICKAKRKDNGEWVEGFLYITHNGEHEIGSYNDELDTERITYIVIPKTVGQCSGVPDKNGTLMYEGDIVKGLFNFGLKIMSVCTFKDGAFGLTAKQCGAYHFSAFTSICNVEYEVIGNIHDNPNLLKIEHDSLCETETYKAGDKQ